MAKANVVIDYNSQGADKAAKDSAKVAAGVDSIGKAQEKTAKSSEQLSEAMDAADSATGGLLNSLKALASNPYMLAVAALVATLGALKSALTSSSAGQAQWNKAMEQISTVVRVVADFIGQKLVKSINDAGGLFKWMGDIIMDFLNVALYPTIKSFNILKDIFTGDFKGAAEEVMGIFDDVAAAAETVVNTVNNVIDGVKQMTDEATKAAKIAGEIADKEEALRQKRNKAIEQEAQYMFLLEKQKGIIADTNKSIDERLKATEDGLKYAKEWGAIGLDLLIRERDILKTRAQMYNLNNEEEQKLAELNRDIFLKQQEMQARQNEFIGQRAGLLQQQAAAELEALKARDAEITKMMVGTMQNANDKLIADAKKLSTALVEVKRQEVEQKKQLSAEEAANELDNKQIILEGTAALMKEGSKQQKAAQVALATIDTFKGAVSAFAGTTGGIVVKSLAAAAALALGFKNVQNIIKTPLPGVGAGGGGGVSAPAPPPIVNLAPVAQVDTKTQNVKAYIVEDELSAGMRSINTKQNVSKL